METSRKDEDSYQYNQNHIPKTREEIIDESIDDFLRTPIDSRCQNEENSQAFEDLNQISKTPLKSIQITVKPSNFNSVLFDWDSTISRLSSKLKPERPRPKSRGLPSIAKREIQKENQEIKKYTFSNVEKKSGNQEMRVVYPPRKNELPMLRKAPSLLCDPKSKRRRRYV